MKGENIKFLIQTDDKKGLISHITSFFFNLDLNILSCQQFTNTIHQQYFMRICLDAADLTFSREELETKFSALAKQLNLNWSVHYSEDITNVAIMVSKPTHCLYDLLERHREGYLKCNIPLVISNHLDLKYIADQYDIPYVHLPISKATKPQQETQVVELLQKHNIELIVLARYMQVLSADFIDKYPQQIINIHHAFLPAFQGANPYLKAYERGVKMIGATAHYATKDLDEGPIIEQDVERVSHESTPQNLKRIGADIEAIVLARAVNSHLENRVIVTGNRTIVFPETSA
ncbi:formyltetrahydrofolate deformylase [Chondrinema litorale]|uniref:formyltetrahydrofolate deformylase n=1 Tax=Chondrinema litorale TaxID=2994555 RepID=UPI0025448C25|nr:formyltetrahydrofolate deformylase [Chondrinema litorale]UZR92459.1 formyltetrahydrofolate deformylase [Chondrinema litorale]